MRIAVRRALSAALFCCAAPVFGESAASIDQVSVRQQWPWSTDIVVEYELSGVTSPVDISVTAYDGGEPIDQDVLRRAMKGSLHGVSSNGRGEFTIDASRLPGAHKGAIPGFKLKLSVGESPANVHEVIYKIFDLVSGECSDVTRAEILNGKYGSYETDFSKIGEGFNTSLDDVLIWTGVTNNLEYKTTKLVMRKIPAKGVTTQIGDYPCQSIKWPESPLRTVSFTNDYFLGVFELTHGQGLTIYTNTQGSTVFNSKDPMRFTNTVDTFERPMNMSDNYARYYLSRWPSEASCQRGAFPDNNSSIVGNIRKKTGILGFDLPTEAVWEYACRAGTTNDFNCGLNYSEEVFKKLARSTHNSKADAYTCQTETVFNYAAEEGGTAIVGSYCPNAWGLYDMHGNLTEFCLDRYVADPSPYAGVDPWGPPYDSTDYLNRVGKGGSYYLNQKYSTSSYRNKAYSNNSNTAYFGIRICLIVP